MPRSRKPAAPTKKGLSPKTFTGMSKKRMESRASNFSVRVPLKENTTVPIQFADDPESFVEFEVHVFQEDGSWKFVPCAGDMCPLCQDEDAKVRGTSYRFAANAWNLEANKMQVLEGPQALAGQVFYRYQRAPERFLKRTYDVTRFKTTPTSYSFELGEEKRINLADKKLIDLEEYVTDQMKAYYGSDLEAAATSLDVEDEDDWEDEDLEDEDDEGFDDDLDEDDDEEEPPRRAKKTTASKRRTRRS